jgi:hypothetical protein
MLARIVSTPDTVPKKAANAGFASKIFGQILADVFDW